MKHPKEFAFHVGKDLIVNHADIFREVSASIDDYHAQKWEDFGKDTGAALSKLLVGTNEMSAAEDEMWPVVLKGVLEGFGLTKDLDEMKACLPLSPFANGGGLGAPPSSCNTDRSPDRMRISASDQK